MQWLPEYPQQQKDPKNYPHPYFPDTDDSSDTFCVQTVTEVSFSAGIVSLAISKHENKMKNSLKTRPKSDTNDRLVTTNRKKLSLKEPRRNKGFSKVSDRSDTFFLKN